MCASRRVLVGLLTRRLCVGDTGGEGATGATQTLQEKLARAKAMKPNLVVGDKVINTSVPDPAAGGR